MTAPDAAAQAATTRRRAMLSAPTTGQEDSAPETKPRKGIRPMRGHLADTPPPTTDPARARRRAMLSGQE